MKRKVILIGMVLSLMVMLFSTVGVTAERGDAPHDGECVAYCARAGVFIDGVRQDLDGDGKMEPCILETNCHKNEATDCGMPVHPPNDNPCWPTCQVIYGPGRPWHGH